MLFISSLFLKKDNTATTQNNNSEQDGKNGKNYYAYAPDSSKNYINKIVSYYGGVIVIPSSWNYIEIGNPENSLYSYVVEIYNGYKYGCTHYYFFSTKEYNALSYPFIIDALTKKYECVKTAMDHEYTIKPNINNYEDAFSYYDKQGNKRTRADYDNEGTTLGIFPLTSNSTNDETIPYVNAENVISHISDPNRFRIHYLLLAAYIDAHYDYFKDSLKFPTLINHLYAYYKTTDFFSNKLEINSLDPMLNMKKLNYLLYSKYGLHIDIILSKALEIYATCDTNIIPTGHLKDLQPRTYRPKLKKSLLQINIKVLNDKFILTDDNNEMIISGKGRDTLILALLADHVGEPLSEKEIHGSVLTPLDKEYYNTNVIFDNISKINIRFKKETHSTYPLVVRNKKSNITGYQLNPDFRISSDIRNFRQYYNYYDGNSSIDISHALEISSIYKNNFLNSYTKKNPWVSHTRSALFNDYSGFILLACVNTYKEAIKKTDYDDICQSFHDLYKLAEAYYSVISNTNYDIISNSYANISIDKSILNKLVDSQSPYVNTPDFLIDCYLIAAYLFCKSDNSLLNKLYEHAYKHYEKEDIDYSVKSIISSLNVRSTDDNAESF